MFRVRRALHALRPPPLVPTAVRTVQILALLHLVTTDLIEVRDTTGFSMLPTLHHAGDRVLVLPLAYWGPWGRRPARGELVVAVAPNDPRATVCKRVVGLAGDLIEIEPRRDDATWTAITDEVDDVRGAQAGREGGARRRARIKERKTDSEGRHVRRAGEGKYVRVPKGSVWLAGDNMSNSTDSRAYGPVPLALIRGRVVARIWPSIKWLDTNIHTLGPG
ncbi:hypothetical protein Q5752_006523 [Cryptotrichosporon argae]